MVKYMDGKDWDASCFSKDFGFSESSKPHKMGKAQLEPVDDDGTYVNSSRKSHRAKAKKPVQEFALGGDVAPPAPGAMSGPMAGGTPPGDSMAGALGRASVTMPAADMMHTARQLVGLGRMQGAAAASRGVHPSQVQPSMVKPPMTRPPTNPAGVQTPMADGGHFIKDAVKHPGRMQRGAKREGVSTHAYMEEHAHDSGSLGSAARLGLRLTSGDLKPHRGSKRKG